MKTNISNEKYRANKAYSRSDLFHMSKSPAHFKYALENPEPETPALLFGTAFHTYVLEREKFDRDYIVVPKVDGRTKEGKALLAQVNESGRVMLSEEQFEQIKRMTESVMSNKYAAALINNGEHEQSYFWTDSKTGIDLKCRPDCRTDLKNVSVIVDLKTTENADTDSFTRSCIKYGYDLQAAMYKQGIELCEGKPHKFVFVAVEKNPPYACNVLEADEFLIKKGSQDMNDYLYELKSCLANNTWYGFNGEKGYPNIISLPSWLAKEYE